MAYWSATQAYVSQTVLSNAAKAITASNQTIYCIEAARQNDSNSQLYSAAFYARASRDLSTAFFAYNSTTAALAQVVRTRVVLAFNEWVTTASMVVPFARPLRQLGESTAIPAGVYLPMPDPVPTSSLRPIMAPPGLAPLSQPLGAPTPGATAKTPALAPSVTTQTPNTTNTTNAPSTAPSTAPTVGITASRSSTTASGQPPSAVTG